MYVCYIDESGTPEIPGNTSHYVLAGFAIPLRHWRPIDKAISAILEQFGLGGEEFHTAWLLRPYLEQTKVSDFEKLDWKSRRIEVDRLRTSHLLRLQRSGPKKSYNQTKKNYTQTKAYIHLTLKERTQLVHQVADMVSKWDTARLFAECIDKVHFSPALAGCTVDEQAFEQLVSRFEQFLVNTENPERGKRYGVLVHDNNETVARKHTELMRTFHKKGTVWTKINRIVDTPLFVNSSLTSMVQIADLCGYALRRYLENGERGLFDKIFARADRIHNTVVGIRHFAPQACACEICHAHKRPVTATASAAGDSSIA
ncbi:MAG TPA: DUF3800 domain-containing protein [Terriglobales bacterium]|nr:DUF3800 domain-containing protein [Terriglobales bacterium]